MATTGTAHFLFPVKILLLYSILNMLVRAHKQRQDTLHFDKRIMHLLMDAVLILDFGVYDGLLSKIFSIIDQMLITQRARCYCTLPAETSVKPINRPPSLCLCTTS